MAEGLTGGDSTREVRVSDGLSGAIIAIVGPSGPRHSTREGRIAFLWSRESSAALLGTMFCYLLGSIVCKTLSEKKSRGSTGDFLAWKSRPSTSPRSHFAL